MSVPWLYMGLAWATCLGCSTLGFKRIVYFVSLSYALSIGAEALLFGAIFSTSIAGWPLAQSALMFLYALRLGGFLLIRARSPAFQKELKHELALGLAAKTTARAALWIGVSLLYVLLYLPTLLLLAAQDRGASLGSVPIGVAIMGVGLLLEAMADQQKSRFKSMHPGRFCDVALYRVVRCPNYLGEIIFWIGVWSSALAAYRTAAAWILSTLGTLAIAGVMFDATRRLEAKQAQRYGADDAYQRYTTTVPVLCPFIPLYSLRPRAASVP